jgi:hypothetical protein
VRATRKSAANPRKCRPEGWSRHRDPNSEDLFPNANPGNRCATCRCCRWRPTVDGAVKCSPDVQLSALFTASFRRLKPFHHNVSLLSAATGRWGGSSRSDPAPLVAQPSHSGGCANLIWDTGSGHRWRSMAAGEWRLSEKPSLLRQPPPQLICKLGNRLHRELCLDGPIRHL